MIREEIKNIQTTMKELRKFGIILSVFLSIIAGISLWKSGTLYNYLFPTAAGILILALAFPRILKFIYIPWMALAILIGWVMTRVILTLLYYLVFTPISLLLNLLGKDLLDEKINPEKSSYWVQREKRIIPKEDFERQF
jgi:multisubunit Na+/H+ antiporter MnhG subunit